MGMTRRSLLGSAAAVALTAGTASAAGATPLWREYSRTPFTHPQIPYVGRTGCHAGAERFPRRRVVADIRDFGAVADGSTDAAPAINRAIAAAGRAGGGTVTIPPGTFRVDDVIRVDRSNVTLKGAGSNRTTLYATKNLTELIGTYGSRYGGDKSSWSWAGGLIWLAPRARWESLVAAIRARAWPFEGWTGNRRDEWRTLTTISPARQGAWRVRVADASALRPGALVLLRLADDGDHTLLEHMCGGGPGPEAYFWDDKTKLTSYVPYEWPPFRRAGTSPALSSEDLPA
ncbi:glycosyl hydrolase family 28-related protein, partial [Streptomyces griseorubiginosus]|uniref:glycosyl hydrolase family 28-related protein n=1 Tax=Streptomyces griseorubiginosus TaxID=67304 RepID=UPI00340C9367